MTFWLSMKLLLVNMTFDLGAEAAETLRTVMTILQDPASSLQLKLALINSLIGTARVYTNLLVELAQRF